MKLGHLVGFITKKFVTMYGHMNVKKCVRLTFNCVAQIHMYCNFRYLALTIPISYILKLITFRTNYFEQNLCSALSLELHRRQSVEPEDNCQSNRWTDQILLQGDVTEVS